MYQQTSQSGFKLIAKQKNIDTITKLHYNVIYLLVVKKNKDNKIIFKFLVRNLCNIIKIPINEISIKN